MKVSVALHTGEPDPRGNQRDYECTYQNYNRQYADMNVDPISGDAFVDFDVTFPKSGEDFRANFFSIGVCIAPKDLGGGIIIHGPIDGSIIAKAGEAPSLNGACFIERIHLSDLGLIVSEGEFWREKTSEELEVTYPRAA